MAQIKLEIKSCKECKHIKTVGRWGSDSWERMEDWFCTEDGKDRKIRDYVEWNEENKIEIPTWCSILVKEVMSDCCDYPIQDFLNRDGTTTKCCIQCLQPIETPRGDNIPRYKFGTYDRDDTETEYDWFIIDTHNDQIVDNFRNMELSEVRQRCGEWNNKKD